MIGRWAGACFVAPLLAGAVVVSVQAEEWPCFQHDPCHTGATNEELTVPLKLLWEKPIGWSTSQAIAVGGRLFVGRWAGDVLCMDQKTGRTLWTYTTGGRVLFSACVADHRVLIGSEDGCFYCLSADGALLWKFRTAGPIWSSPVAAEGLVFFGSKDGRLYAVRLSDGEASWTYDFHSPVWSSPAYHDGAVFCGSKHGLFAALDARTGEPRWTFHTYGWMVNNSPSLAEGRVFVAALHAQYLAETGEWHLWTQGHSKLGEVLAGQGRTACLFCLDERTGLRLWELPTPQHVLGQSASTGAASDSPPLFCAPGVTPTLAGGNVYVDATSYPFGDGQRRLIVVASTTGRLVAHSGTAGLGLFASPAVASQVLVTPRLALVRALAFDPATLQCLGAVLGWSPGLDTAGHTGYGIQFLGSPSCADGVLFVVGAVRHNEAAGNGYIRAYVSGASPRRP